MSEGDDFVIPPKYLDQLGEPLVDGDNVSLGSFVMKFFIKMEHTQSKSGIIHYFKSHLTYTYIMQGMGSSGTSKMNYIAGASVADQRETDFKPELHITDVEMLKVDYERLRVAYLFNRRVVESDPQRMIERAVVCLLFNSEYVLFFWPFTILGCYISAVSTSRECCCVGGEG
jgi:hypothetical protein